MKTLKMSLCAGRHVIPDATDGSIFEGEINPLDPSGLMDKAIDILNPLFEDVSSTCMVNRQTDYTDIPFVCKEGRLILFVTGLSVALVAVINACNSINLDLQLMHYDRESGQYYPQKVVHQIH